MGVRKARAQKFRRPDADGSSDIATRFSKVASILKPLTLGRDAIIFSVSGPFIRAEIASGRFSSLVDAPLSRAFEPLARALSVKVGSAAVIEVDEEARPRLGLPEFPDGSLALICLEASRDQLVCAAIFESSENGRLSPDAIFALQATARLSSERGASAPSLDIEQTRNFYRHFTHALHQCFWAYDADTGDVLAVSENFEDIWGSPRSILMDGFNGFAASVVPEDRDRVLAEFYNHLELGFDLEFRLLVSTGESDSPPAVHWMRLRGLRFEDETQFGRKVLLLIGEDITQKKETEEKARMSELMSIAHARALAVVDLASGVAHEINNPLTIIVGRASEMERKIEKGEIDKKTVSDFVEKVRTTALRMADVVRSLKSLASQDRASGFALCSVSKIAHDVSEFSFERAKNESVRLTFEAINEKLCGEMNPTLISQVVLNLVNNAVDAVAELDEKWVKVDFSDDVDSIYIGVTDSGSGIPIKLRSRIFDPFFTTKDPGKGTGLGLSLSASIAARHNGALRIDTLHKHTRFVLQIPKKQTRSHT